MSWEDEGIPNPGSFLAIERGCTCAVVDNHHGQGLTSGYGTPEKPVFWVTGGCPLHAPAEDPKPLPPDYWETAQ